MPDQMTLLFVAGKLRLRAEVERIVRDDARRAGEQDAATMHGDRAQILTDALHEIVANDDRDFTDGDLQQHDRNAGYARGVRAMAEIARAALKRTGSDAAE